MWSAYLFQTSSGIIGPPLNFESVTWSVSLNETESMKFDLRKSDLPGVDINVWLSPWWGGVVLLWDGVPIVAGPIVSIPTESYDDISIECRGIREVLAHRLTIDEQPNWVELPTKKVEYRGLSLGTIAQEVVKLAQTKPGGVLPIVFPVLEGMPSNLPACPHEDIFQDNCYWNSATMGNGTGRSYYTINGETTFLDQGKGIHERTYQSFNLSNIFVDDVLTKLSEVINGPDIMFRPRLVGDNRLVYDMLYGTENDPRIGQKHTPVWDTTAPDGQVSDMRITRTGMYQTHRVFAVGAGMDEGTLIRMAQDLGPTSAGYPLLETVQAYNSVETPAVLQNHAAANVEQNTEALLEISMTVRADGPFPLGTFFPGDLVEIFVKGWVGLKDGPLRARLLNINGDSSTNVKMALQIED